MAAWRATCCNSCRTVKVQTVPAARIGWRSLAVDHLYGEQASRQEVMGLCWTVSASSHALEVPSARRAQGHRTTWPQLQRWAGMR